MPEGITGPTTQGRYADEFSNYGWQRDPTLPRLT
jgi:hypothetical protein